MIPPDVIGQAGSLVLEAQHWFTPSVSDPWRWRENGRILEWVDGTTLCFAEELALIFRRLEPRQAPHFRSIVYLLAACRRRLPDAEAVLEEVSGSYREIVRKTIADLARISTADAKLTASVEARAELIDMVVNTPETGRRGKPAMSLLDVWLDGAATDEPAGIKVRFDPRPLAVMEKGLRNFSAEALALRMRTGLEELPVPAPLPEAEVLSVRDLLEQLRGDEELGGMTRLAREIMAALKVPRALAAPEDLPVGGWADVSNRGTPDRLLLTELAQDPLMLAVRVAQQEALYLRREPPARREEPPAALLIDTGLRLWGVPRVFAASVALALAASRESGGDRRPAGACRAFRTAAGRAVPVLLNTREGLAGLLEQAEPSLDPLPALRDFVRILKDYAGASDGHAPLPEPFFVTHTDMLDDASFRTALRDEIPSAFIAAVNGAGEFFLYHWQPRRGLKLLSGATLNLDQLFPPAAGHPRARLANGARELPVFLSMKPEPLLVSAKGTTVCSVVTPDGMVFAVQDDRSLLAWHVGDERNRRNTGCAMWVRRLPAGHILLLEALSATEVAVLIAMDGCRRTPTLVLAGPHESRETPVDALPPWQEVTAHGGFAFFTCRGRTIHAISLRTGAAVAEPLDLSVFYVLPRGIVRAVPSEGNGTEKFCRLWADTQRVGYSVIPAPANRSRENYDRQRNFLIWERVATGTLDVLYEDGTHCALSGEGSAASFRLPKPVYRVLPSSDGALLQISGIDEVLVLSVKDGRSRKTVGYDVNFPRRSAFLPPVRTCFARVQRAGVTSDAGLCLQTSYGLWFTFQVINKVMHWTAQSMNFRPHSERAFRRLPHDQLDLQEAGWDNLRVIFDRRGFVHLIPVNIGAPQATIVTQFAGAAVWTSDGTIAGDRFYTGISGPVTKSGDADPSDEAAAAVSGLIKLVFQSRS